MPVIDSQKFNHKSPQGDKLQSGWVLPKSKRDPHGMIVGQGQFRYRVNAYWGRLDNSQTPVENCHGLDIDAKGRVVMITDDPRNNIVIYNRDGKLIDTFSTHMPGGHSIKIVNENGEDFMYLVDSGWVKNRLWDGHSTEAWDSPYNRVVAQSGFIAKLDMAGRLIFSIGHPQTYGVYRPDQPFRPTDIAISDNGDLYVTDGYGSDYLLQYDNQGRFIRRWGGHYNIDANYNLSNTHGIGIDKRTNTPELIVSSRGAQCLKRFTLSGEYLGTIDANGAYIGGPIFKGEHFYAPVCWSHIDGKNQDDSGFISVFDKDNRVVANIGGTTPEYINDVLQPMQTTWDVFNHCHGLCVDDDSNLYVGQWNANQSYPMKLERL
ncbi:peptidylglycine monooxygenase-like protein [Paraglaciecola sp. T6c]|uniref:type I secretion protein TolC n=1 Tax=Pseudoalteromonas atlantica (strain T6c / ATCC BAA-1087) TaxID=3042615 RepID=UPI00005C6C49|nr:type I secretion protein TolC [Paraglaciecola sp. T6c]ABG40480.1 peptidylglycine monooxygenase-like protein [Paraglaciecola sp. T6c]